MLAHGSFYGTIIPGDMYVSMGRIWYIVRCIYGESLYTDIIDLTEVLYCTGNNRILWFGYNEF